MITIARFLIHLGSTCAYSTCNNYLSGIITLHRFMGHSSDFRDYFVIKLVLKGLAKRLGTHVNQKTCFDIVSMLSTHFFRTPQLVQGPLFYLFSKGKWSPLLYKDLLEFLKSCVSIINLDRNEVGLHSLRRSGAAFLQSINISLVDIMNSGDWKSLAALTYLVSPLSRKLTIEQQVVDQLESI